MRRLIALAIITLVSIAPRCAITDPEETLEEGRALWARNGPASYEMTVFRSCECLPGASGPVRVVVRNGVVESRTHLWFNAPVEPQFAAAYPSVDGLFDLLESAVDAGTTPIEVRYHRTLGYPLHMELGDPALDAPAYSVTDFHPL